MGAAANDAGFGIGGFTDLAQRRSQETSFWKNIAMLGGFAFLFVTGAGRLSLDNLLGKRG